MHILVERLLSEEECLVRSWRPACRRQCLSPDKLGVQYQGDRRTARSSTNVFDGSVERYGFETFGVVWTYGTQDDEEEGFVGWANTDSLLVAD